MIDQLRAAVDERYAVDREIGRGGMATVYLAHDVKHRRRVAIKVLRPELSAAVGAERFLREIEIAARLTHPHILPLLDSGSAGRVLFYVMPFLEGESLEGRLLREGRVPWDEAVAITREVAGALDYAHRQGLVHRDIKPANILLTRGHAMIGDFGVARAIRANPDAPVTQAGMTVGTPAYMSPEQASADLPTDGRTDIYALGCVLHEMLTGSVPFSGKNAQEIMTRVLRAPAPRVQTAGVPVFVRDAVSRCLQKNPSDRFETAGDLAESLAPAPGTRPTTKRQPSWRALVLTATVVAVLLVGLALLA
jgi:eukaryotic-like serine/threonine-protein kinase